MLMRAALRICAVEAVRGRTFAGQAVRDSEIVSMAPKLTDERLPFIAVYTDDFEDGMLTISWQIGVSASMRGEGGNLISGIPPTDWGIEMTIDFIERQIRTALADPDNDWAEVFRKGVNSPAPPKSERGAAMQDGERFAGRQVLQVVRPLGEPEYGRALGPKSFWRMFLDQMATDARFDEIGPIFEGLLGVGETVSDWRLVQRALGATRAQAEALGFAPASGDEPETIAGHAIDGGHTIDDGPAGE